jgi:putative transposase
LEAGKDSADGVAVLACTSLIGACTDFKPTSTNYARTAGSGCRCAGKKRSDQSGERWHENHANVVGAVNILSRWMQQLRDEGQDTTDASVGIQVGAPLESARMACGSNGAGRRKQEPAETTAQGTIHA